MISRLKLWRTQKKLARSMSAHSPGFASEDVWQRIAMNLPETPQPRRPTSSWKSRWLAALLVPSLAALGTLLYFSVDAPQTWTGIKSGNSQPQALPNLEFAIVSGTTLERGRDGMSLPVNSQLIFSLRNHLGGDVSLQAITPNGSSELIAQGISAGEATLKREGDFLSYKLTQSGTYQFHLVRNESGRQENHNAHSRFAVRVHR